jgi:hypothetical protein
MRQNLYLAMGEAGAGGGAGRIPSQSAVMARERKR